jgi:hypothetical protein
MPAISTGERAAWGSIESERDDTILDGDSELGKSSLRAAEFSLEVSQLSTDSNVSGEEEDFARIERTWLKSRSSSGTSKSSRSSTQASTRLMGLIRVMIPVYVGRLESIISCVIVVIGLVDRTNSSSSLSL